MSLCDWRFTNRRLHPTKGPSVHTETKVKVGGGFETTTVDLDFFSSCVVCEMWGRTDGCGNPGRCRRFVIGP